MFFKKRSISKETIPASQLLCHDTVLGKLHPHFTWWKREFKIFFADLPVFINFTESFLTFANLLMFASSWNHGILRKFMPSINVQKKNEILELVPPEESLEV